MEEPILNTHNKSEWEPAHLGGDILYTCCITVNVPDVQGDQAAGEILGIGQETGTC